MERNSALIPALHRPLKGHILILCSHNGYVQLYIIYRRRKGDKLTMKKILLTLLGALTVSAVMAVTAFAGIGEWRQNDYGYWWQRTDGSYPANTWKWIDGDGDGIAECYHFDRSG